MPLIAYDTKNFADATLRTIEQANEIIDEYLADGYSLTLRQLYYQFVARDLIPNRVKEYNRLGRIVSDARIAGLMDWDAIEDRTRNLDELPHWASAADIVEEDSRAFRIDMWENQPGRVEVWIEKEALAGVFERVCRQYDVPFFSCRGYTSQSEMWRAAERIIEYGTVPVILHFGDHDPSGIDMTRDIEDRLELFGAAFDLRRLALNMDQVQRWSPPPNPAKTTDARFAGYAKRFGGQSWELDALEPRVLADLVRREVESLIDEEAWEESEKAIQEGREVLRKISKRWDDVSAFLANGAGPHA